ncbi:MAG: hypothetical protein SFZ03_05720 [Candidatus Melainabacteria bacterium]|nr:hypothetical protein [Candidatus Melainabacteria bacterium]
MVTGLSQCVSSSVVSSSVGSSRPDSLRFAGERATVLAAEGTPLQSVPDAYRPLYVTELQRAFRSDGNTRIKALPSALLKLVDAPDQDTGFARFARLAKTLQRKQTTEGVAPFALTRLGGGIYGKTYLFTADDTPYVLKVYRPFQLFPRLFRSGPYLEPSLLMLAEGHQVRDSVRLVAADPAHGWMIAEYRTETTTEDIPKRGKQNFADIGISFLDDDPALENAKGGVRVDPGCWVTPEDWLAKPWVKAVVQGVRRTVQQVLGV